MIKGVLKFIPTAVQLAIALSSITLLLAACQEGSERSASSPIEKTVIDERPPRMVSAFFGLDNALPPRAVALSRSAPGRDGMPVTFSRRVVEPIDPTVFTVVTRSGERYHPLDATTRPADDPAKRHTVLLIGELGDEPEDPPIRVEVTSNLALAGDADALGMSVPVTPLVDGPSIVLAYSASPGQFEKEHPPNTKQIIVVVWAGGVRPMPGVSTENHRDGYTITTINGDVLPIGIGDLGDNDNYEHIYLDTADKPLRVSMRKGLLMDPRDDPNPPTEVEVAGLVSP